MDNQLASEILALEEQVRAYTAEFDKATDGAAMTAWQAEIDSANAKLAAKRNQAQAVEGDIQDAQTSIMEQFDQIVVEGQVYSLRDFTINEEFAQVLSLWFQQKAGDIAQQYSSLARSYKQENEELIDLMDERDATIANLRSENYRIDLIGADLQTKLENASNIILEKDEEIKRLGSELKSVRENVAPKPAVATNTSANLGEMMRAALANRPAIYNYVNHGFNKNTAILAETGEEITFKDINKGAYRIISEEEALQFRKESEAVQVEVVTDEVVLPISIEPPSLPFQPDKNSEMDVTGGGNTFVSEMVEQTLEEKLRLYEIRIEERFQYLEQVRIKRIEDKVFVSLTA